MEGQKNVPLGVAVVAAVTAVAARRGCAASVLQEVAPFLDCNGYILPHPILSDASGRANQATSVEQDKVPYCTGD